MKFLSLTQPSSKLKSQPSKDKLSFIIRHLGKFTTHSDDDNPLIAGVMGTDIPDSDPDSNSESDSNDSDNQDQDNKSSSDKDSINSDKLADITSNTTTTDTQQQEDNPSIVKEEPPEPKLRPQQQRKQPTIMKISDTNTQTHNVNNAVIKDCKCKLKKIHKRIDETAGVCHNFEKKVCFNDILVNSDCSCSV